MTDGDGPPTGHVRAADVASRVGRSGRLVNEWLRRHAKGRPEALLYLPAQHGGKELWVTQAAAEAAVAFYGEPVTDTPTDADGPVTAPGDGPVADGWQEALAESRARAAAAEARADTLAAELAVARVDAQDARRRAEEAERALAVTNERLASLRAAWWRWRLLLESLGPVARWRRRWPASPGEFETDPLLAKPVE